MVLVEEDCDKMKVNAPVRSKRRWKQRTAECRKAKDGLDGKDEARVKLMRF